MLSKCNVYVKLKQNEYQEKYLRIRISTNALVNLSSGINVLTRFNLILIIHIRILPVDLSVLPIQSSILFLRLPGVSIRNKIKIKIVRLRSNIKLKR